MIRSLIFLPVVLSFTSCASDSHAHADQTSSELSLAHFDPESNSNSNAPWAYRVGVPSNSADQLDHWSH
jgi:hypothetical protein